MELKAQIAKFLVSQNSLSTRVRIRGQNKQVIVMGLIDVAIRSESRSATSLGLALFPEICHRVLQQGSRGGDAG